MWENWKEMKCAHLTRATHTDAVENSQTDRGTGEVVSHKDTEGMMVAKAVPKGQTPGTSLMIFLKEWFWVFFIFSEAVSIQQIGKLIRLRLGATDNRLDGYTLEIKGITRSTDRQVDASSVVLDLPGSCCNYGFKVRV